MPTFILAGCQRTLAPRLTKALKGAAGTLGDWAPVQFTGHMNKQHDIGVAQVDELLQLADQHEGAHVLGVSTMSTRAQVEERIRPFFRFRWLETKPLGLVGTGDQEALIEMLKRVLQEESFWATHVRPRDFASPLTLPEIFSCKKELKDMWRLARSYNNEGHLSAAVARVERFVQAHRRKVEGFGKSPWCAEDDWIWDDAGERHGSPQFPMDWKYSLKLPDGFHFDVSTSVKGKSHFEDRSGRRHAYKKHMNVTAHGDVRGQSSA